MRRSTAGPRPQIAVSLVLGLALLALVPALPVQGRVPVGVEGREVTTSIERSRVLPLPLVATHVALHWPGAHDARVTIAFSSDGVSFGAAQPVEHDDTAKDATDHTYGGVIWTTGARFVRITSDRAIPLLSVVAIDARSPSRTNEVPAAHVAAAAVEQPAVITRSGWGANESLRFDEFGTEKWVPEFHPIQKLTVHHTAGRNDDPDPAATVRAIYYYQAITRDWGDIGYNFLIDESGRIYEGRYSRPYPDNESPTGESPEGLGVTGAHVGGYNAGTVGVALLGTLTEQDATPAARAALEQLLAWKAERHSIDPMAAGLYTNPVSGVQREVSNISGHRDWAATECPGGTFYETLPALRQSVSARITGEEPPPQTAPAAPVLTAKTPTTGRGVKLNWTVPGDGGSPITAYKVLRLKNGSFVTIATVAGTTLGYRDGTAKRGRTYTYVVRAVNAIGPGPNSNEATAKAR